MAYSEIQKKTLRILLKKYESSKTYTAQNEISQSFSVLPEKIFPDYVNDFADVDKIHDFESEIASLEDESFVTLLKKDGRIQKITACATAENWNRIRTILGVKDKNERLKEEINFYSAFCENPKTDSIVKDFCETQILRLESGKEAEFEKEDARNIISLLNFILENKTEILERELSISVQSNSKTWEEKYKSRVTKILRKSGRFDSLTENCSDEKEANKVILEELNVFSNPSYIYFKGSGKITFENGNIVTVFPDIPFAVSSSSIDKISSIEIFDSAVMTVENLTSFNRIKKVETFFLYLSGYHNSAKQKFLKKLHRQNEDKTYFHFGDIDPDGFFILENLRAKTHIDFVPYKMGIAELKKYASFSKPLEKNDITKAHSLMQKDLFTDVADYMLSHNLKLEQEIVSWKEGE